MLGFRITRPIITRFQWWIVACVSLFDCLIGILTLGYLATDWEIRCFAYFSYERRDSLTSLERDRNHRFHNWIWDYTQKGPVTKK